MFAFEELRRVDGAGVVGSGDGGNEGFDSGAEG